MVKVVLNVVEDKEFLNNLGSECSFLNFYCFKWKDEGDKLSVLFVEYNFIEILSFVIINIL